MTVENEKDLIGLMTIGRIVGECLNYMLEHVEAGMSTADIDEMGAAFLKKHGARSAPILAYKFPGYTCISINDEAAHGIPRKDRLIYPGDMVNIDVSAEKDGYWADNGRSMVVPPVDPERQRLVDASKKALDIAISKAKAGMPISEIGKAVEAYAKKQGFAIIRDLGGHGVGRGIHEAPSVPHHYDRRDRRGRKRLREGMVLTLEPFLTTGAQHIDTDPDGWTLRTPDGSLVAQHEHTLVITKDKPILVTAV